MSQYCYVCGRVLRVLGITGVLGSVLLLLSVGLLNRCSRSN